MYDGGYGMSLNDPVLWGGFVLFYLSHAFSLYKIAKNHGEEAKAWWALVPVVQMALLLKVARKPTWWFFLFFVPIVNLIPFVAAWIGVAHTCGKSTAWGILTLIPLVNLFIMAALAFSRPKFSFFAPPTLPEQKRTPQNVG